MTHINGTMTQTTLDKLNAQIMELELFGEYAEALKIKKKIAIAMGMTLEEYLQDTE